MNRHLNTQVRSGVPVNDKALWDHVYDSFRRQYADMQERERAEDTLQQGISMRAGKLDAYIAEYEVLIEMAGYDPNSRLTLNVMTPPMVGSTWPRVRSTLGSDCLPALSQGTVLFCLFMDLIVIFVFCVRMFDVQCPVILGLY